MRNTREISPRNERRRKKDRRKLRNRANDFQRAHLSRPSKRRPTTNFPSVRPMRYVVIACTGFFYRRNFKKNISSVIYMKSVFDGTKEFLSKKKSAKGEEKIIMKPLPVMDKAYFSDYTRLLAKVDTFCARLKTVHAPQLLCRRGCCDCCKQDLHLLPLEFHFIRQGLTDRFAKAFNHHRRRPDIHQHSCLLLGNGDCQLYEHRPIICRSHGLPLLITQDDQTWRDCCPKNFPTQPPLNEFPESGLLHLERLNTILIMLNKRFCSRTGLDPAKRKSISSLPNP